VSATDPSDHLVPQAMAQVAEGEHPKPEPDDPTTSADSATPPAERSSDVGVLSRRRIAEPAEDLAADVDAVSSSMSAVSTPVVVNRKTSRSTRSIDSVHGAAVSACSKTSLPG
jgi:hypothetical protein